MGQHDSNILPFDSKLLFRSSVVITGGISFKTLHVRDTKKKDNE